MLKIRLWTEIGVANPVSVKYTTLGTLLGTVLECIIMVFRGLKDVMALCLYSSHYVQIELKA